MAAPMRQRSILASIVLGLATAVLAGLLRNPAWRANLAWMLRTWIRPPDRESVWEQESGVRLDPWDRLVHASGGRRGTGGTQEHPQAAPAALGR